MLNKEIFEGTISERSYSTISKDLRCMNCKLNKSKYFDINDNIILCKRCLKKSKKLKVVGSHKLTSKEIDFFQKNNNQLSFEINNSPRFFFKNFFSKYFGNNKYKQNSPLREKERMETLKLESENYSDIEWDFFSKENNFGRRNTFDFCSIYEHEKLESLPLAFDKKHTSLDYEGKYIFTNENLSYCLGFLDKDFTCIHNNIGYENNEGLGKNCNNKTYEYNENCYITKDHLSINNKPNLTSKNPFDLF